MRPITDPKLGDPVDFPVDPPSRPIDPIELFVATARPCRTARICGCPRARRRPTSIPRPGRRSSCRGVALANQSRFDGMDRIGDLRSLLQQTADAARAGKPLPPDVELIVTNFGGRSTDNEIFSAADSALARRDLEIQRLRAAGRWVVVVVTLEMPKAFDVLGWAIGLAQLDRKPKFVAVSFQHGRTREEAENPPPTPAEIRAAPPGPPPAIVWSQGPPEGRAWRDFFYKGYKPVPALR